MRVWTLTFTILLRNYRIHFNSLVWENLPTFWTDRPSSVKKKDELRVSDAPDVLGLGVVGWGYPEPVLQSSEPTDPELRCTAHYFTVNIGKSLKSLLKDELPR